jgi:hypothetical protein
MADKVTKPKPVVFNVGGKHFEASRTVIDQHEDSMLARLVSETWIENPEQAVFIDRDGVIFAQILNYHGSVSFPRTVRKSDFLRDLEYYANLREGEVLITNLKGLRGVHSQVGNQRNSKRKERAFGQTVR